jgi:hypothetical protein
MSPRLDGRPDYIGFFLPLGAMLAFIWFVAS